MKGLSEIVASNVEAAKRVEQRRKQSLRRLKARIAGESHRWPQSRALRLMVNAAIDAWDAAERKRGER